MKKIGLIMGTLALSSVLLAAKQPKAKPSGAKAPTDTEAHAAGAPSTDTKSYIIGAEDILFIQVWDNAQLTGPRTVRPDGKISLPLAGELQAAGLTPEKVGANLAEALTKVMVHPDVTVTVQQINSKKYFISGEVSKTGAFPLLVPTKVSEALVNAGGFRDFAKKSKILIIRGSQRFYFNYNDVVIHGKHLETDILIEPGDLIIIQ